MGVQDGVCYGSDRVTMVRWDILWHRIGQNRWNSVGDQCPLTLGVSQQNLIKWAGLLKLSATNIAPTNSSLSRWQTKSFKLSSRPLGATCTTAAAAWSFQKCYFHHCPTQFFIFRPSRHRSRPPATTPASTFQTNMGMQIAVYIFRNLNNNQGGSLGQAIPEEVACY